MSLVFRNAVMLSENQQVPRLRQITIFMDLKKALNLNGYDWWRNHRRVVTFGGFLVLFGCWVNPVIQESRNKNSCVRTYSELYTVPEVLGKFNAKQLEEFGLDTNDFAKALAYQTCTSQKAIGK